MEELKKMEELNNYLTSALSEYKTRGKAYAEAYKNYRVLLSQELLKLKAEGMPVTICSDLARRQKRSCRSQRTGNYYGVFI